jgi:hypothetical protein
VSASLNVLALLGGTAVVLAWVLTVVDIVRRPGLSRRRRVGWLALVSLVVPTTLLWLLVRPSNASLDVISETLPDDDPRLQLVELVEAHDGGELSPEHYRRAVRSLWDGAAPAG